jgi:chromosome segregation and condensation protein ScpB
LNSEKTLKKVIEAALFAAGEPLSIERLQALFTRTTSRARRPSAIRWILLPETASSAA